MVSRPSGVPRGRSDPDRRTTPGRPTRTGGLHRGLRGGRHRAGWKDRVDLVAAQSGDKPLPASAVLVRPDGYIAWAASVGSHERPAHHGLREALSAWFGAAR
ncbi:hypothetical protein ACFRDV_20535 [Streptomyces fagopyri]|uniref:aromatic-ring hydroxylase C-terminal domain-containing protein n=1 Tax=Streptomyces fagopyri TaxID=2662397 RepID=UPI0036BC5F4F